MKNKQT